MNTIIYLLFFITGSVVSNNAMEIKEDTIIKYNGIRSDSEATEVALNYLGFNQKRDDLLIDSILIECDKIRMTDTTTPFLRGKIDGRTSWSVRISNIVCKLKENKPDINIMSPAHLCIYLDSANGLPLKVFYKSKHQIEREPTANESEKLLGVCGEEYVDLPNIPPLISFWNALNRCDYYPGMAKEIIANYVLYKQKHYTEARPAWIIYMRGLPPISLREDVPLQYRTNMRYVIDAENGVELWRNNMPYPLINED